MKTSVVIPCWITDTTQLSLTQRCVSSVRETSDVELILVDNGSKLGSDYLKDEADVYINFPLNMGYTVAINNGFKHSSGKYLVAGNNDYFMSPGWEEAQIEVLECVKDAGIACLQVLGGVPQSDFWEEPGTPGGWWMIKRDLQEKLGYMDEDFFNVFADYDYLWRMKNLTGKIVVSTPKVTVQHYGEASLGKFKDREREYNRGQWVLLNKWKNDPNIQEYIHRVIDRTDIEKWLEENIEYSKSIDFTS